MNIITILLTLLLSLHTHTHSLSPSPITLDSFNPDQLDGLLNGKWKEQLLGKIKEKVGSLILPSI